MIKYNIISKLDLDSLASATSDVIEGGQVFGERSLYPLSKEDGKLIVAPAEAPVVGLFPIAYVKPSSNNGYEIIANDVIIGFLFENGSVDIAIPISSGNPQEILDELEYLSILSREAFRKTANRN